MIVGVGIDLVSIARVKRIVSGEAGERFVQRVLTPAERELAEGRRNRLAEFVAGRFAAKEAAVKALGCGIGKQVGFRDIEVVPDALGKPLCTLTDAAWARLGYTAETVRLHLSITHTDETAAAYAVAERVK